MFSRPRRSDGPAVLRYGVRIEHYFKPGLVNGDPENNHSLLMTRRYGTEAVRMVRVILDEYNGRHGVKLRVARVKALSWLQWSKRVWKHVGPERLEEKEFMA